VPVPQLAFLLEASVAGYASSPRPGPGRSPARLLARIGKLGRIEGDIRGRTADDRSRICQEYGWPLVDAREPWPRDNLKLISQKTKSRRGDPIHPASLAWPQPLRRTQRCSERIYEIAETGTRYCTDAFMSCCEAACELRQPDPGWARSRESFPEG
jgi:hypothetical protein